jgi:pimeloyl-ACP methyl ester carboxylesterase
MVLLLHGVMSSAETFDRCTRSLLRACPWPTVAFDLPGHGSRAVVDGATDSIDAMALDVARRLDRHHRYLVIGHSLGAVIGLRLAKLEPDLVLGVVLEDPPGLSSIDPKNVAVEVADASRRARCSPEAEIRSLEAAGWSRSESEQVVRSRRLFDACAMAQFLRTARWDLPSLVRQSPAALQLIAATEPASALRGTDRQALLGLIEPHRTRIVESGHTVHRDDPAAWSAAVLSFTAELCE